MKKMKYSKLLVCSLLLLSHQGVNAQLLKGVLKAPQKVETLQIAYSLNGDVLSNVYRDITCEADGSFTFDTQLPKPNYDVSIYVNNDIFGVHLETGKTAQVKIEQDKEGKFQISFGGDNQNLSKFYNAYSRAFDIMKYFSIDPKESKTTDEYISLLEKEYADLKKQLKIIKDDKQREYYAKLSDGMYKWTYIRILMDDSENTGKKLKEYPEYNKLIASIDPNDTINIPTNLTIAWLSSQQEPITDYTADQSDYYLESLNVIGKQITNPDIRFVLTNSVAYNFFSFVAQNSDVNKFWTGFKEFAKDYPQLITSYEPQVTALLKTKKGSEIPYIPTLTRPDGTTCSLSDLFGKLIYIDVWATWCGPCCKEIPSLAKLAAHYQGNDKVCIISVSVDQNQKAWLKKLDTDKPAWPQYILSQEEQNKFMQKWAINGIPRFILISKDGKILNADALRPSDEKIIETIDSNL